MTVPREVSESVDRADRRHAVLLTAFSVPLGALAVAVLLISDEGPGRLGAVGLALLAAAMIVAAVDAWRPFPRPRPRVEVDGVVVAASRLHGLTLVAVALGTVMVVASFVLGDGLLAIADRDRRGLLLLLAAPTTPFLLAAAVWLAVRTDQLRLGGDGVAVRRLGRTVHLPWERLGSVELLAGNPGRVVRLHQEGGKAAVVSTRHMQPPVGRMIAVLEHLRDLPGGQPPLEPSDVADRLVGTAADPPPRGTAS